jgi:hypothetical protein
VALLAAIAVKLFISHQADSFCLFCKATVRAISQKSAHFAGALANQRVELLRTTGARPPSGGWTGAVRPGLLNEECIHHEKTARRWLVEPGRLGIGDGSGFRLVRLLWLSLALLLEMLQHHLLPAIQRVYPSLLRKHLLRWLLPAGALRAAAAGFLPAAL